MQVFEVGGAVRDALLGIKVLERDFVVVGETAESMLAQGFRAVGKDFPVFLHPETGEEYALARTEKKIGLGYHGFSMVATPSVSLDEDLLRRDLTINAMARDAKGMLIDPYGGQRDLDARLLRHVSPAFVEDPVRILRVARFAARFRGLGFTVAGDTLDLMRQMVFAGEVDALVPERVFLEFQKALTTEAPEVFLELLRACGALSRLMPEIDRLFGVPQDPLRHPEIDAGLHTLLVLRAAARLSDDPVVRLAALCHDFGKGATPVADWPCHPNHEVRGLPLLEAFGERLRLPKTYRAVAKKVLCLHGIIHRAESLSAEALLTLIEQLDGIRQPDQLKAVLLACHADVRGRPGFEDADYPQAQRILRALEIIRSVSAGMFKAPDLKGKALGEVLRTARIQAIEGALAIVP
jgi:tRNA nucleotidyltransferase (CCA-adding enzyme)